MKRLGLLRHAKSDWSNANQRDFDRGLNARGRQGATIIGQHIRDHGVSFDRIIASSAERVRQTLESAELPWPIEFTRRAYLADPQTLIDLAVQTGQTANGYDSLLIAGHNPGLEDLVFDLPAPDDHSPLVEEARKKLPTASFLIFELEIDEWADLKNGCGKLVHFVRPRDLDRNLGPERH